MASHWLKFTALVVFLQITFGQGFNVDFLLYTPFNPSVPHKLDRNDVTSLVTSNFDVTLPTKIISHGYRESGYSDWIERMRDELLIYGNMNVIVVDWQDGSSGWYFTCADNTDKVGEEIHLLLQFLQQQVSLAFEDVHLIGFSLGAQVSGHAGKRNPSIGRISGLDPAGPDFENQDTDVHLDSSDAQFVDVIHTDAEPLWQGGFGYYNPCGHVDFYPNGGTQQPGCGLIGEVCHHMRAPDLFIESINTPCPFTAYPCPLGDRSCSSCDGNCGYMGFHADKSQTLGVFFLETNSDIPYCKA
ncbi:pancreatic lipase-related protein 2-like [Glandiceps talaboti]